MHTERRKRSAKKNINYMNEEGIYLRVVYSHSARLVFASECGSRKYTKTHSARRRTHMSTNSE